MKVAWKRVGESIACALLLGLAVIVLAVLAIALAVGGSE